jgi:ubiquinone/menaquinone biosynthesis C-methylase UbiE
MFANPEENIGRLHLKEGEKVADFGAGTGAYAIAAGKKVGGGGKVYAVEVQDTLLPRIANAAREAGLSNVKTLWGDIEEVGGTAIPDQSVDAVILSNVLRTKTVFSGRFQEFFAEEGEFSSLTGKIRLAISAPHLRWSWHPTRRKSCF